MAINQNHLFEELNGVKCAIVEKNVAPGRVEFLRGILGFNGYSVMVVPSPPPKSAGVPVKSEVEEIGVGEAAPLPPPAPETFTVGVTDVMFNAVNAIFGRLLKAPGGQVVTLAFWKQQENKPDNEKPYFA